MGIDAFSFRADLRRPDGQGNVRGEDFQLSAISLSNQIADITSIICSAVHHGQKDAFDAQIGVDLPPYFGDGL